MLETTHSRHLLSAEEKSFRAAFTPLVRLLAILTCALGFLYSTSGAQAGDEKYPSLTDSLKNLQAVKSPAELSLQQILNNLGYQINVATDETGIATFCALPGQNIATIVVEYAASAVSAKSGWYVANDSSVLHQLFQGSNVPGDSAQFVVTGGDSIGFYMKPGLSGQETTVWFTQNSMSYDLYDHAWIFRTGVPHEYIVAWEDWPGGGDHDHQDLVLKVRFANQNPVVTLRPDSSVFQCTPAQICFPISATDANCEGDTLTLIKTSGPGTFTQIKQKGPISATHCFTPTTAGVYEFIFKVTDILGASSYDTMNITVALNQPPVAACHGDTAMFVCNLAPITLGGYSCTDADGNLTSCAAVGGTYSSGQVTFTPVAGANTLKLIATDACGKADTCQTVVNVSLNVAPDASCHGDTAMLVCSLAPITLGGYNCTDADGNLASCAAVGGTYAGGQVTFTPVAGANTIKLIATDGCGKKDTCQTVVNVALNVAPDASCHGDTSMFVCSLAPITLGGYSCTDADGNLTSCLAVGGTYASGQVTFTPVVGANTIKLIATDGCGKADTCQTVVNVGLNVAPDATCHGDTAMFVCSLAPITLGGYSCTDADGNLTSCAAVGGTYAGGQVTFTPVAGANTIKLIATDGCGKKDTCQTVVNVSLNTAPDASCHGDTSMFVCSLAPITLGGYSCTDANGNLTSCAAVGGTYASGQVTFTPVVGANTIKLIAADGCGKADTCQTVVNVSLNVAPDASCHGDTAMFVCNLAPITLGGYSCTDADGNLTSCAAVGGTYAGGQVTFTPVAGANTIKLIATDGCGKADTCQTVVNVSLNVAPDASCHGDTAMFVCNLAPITLGGYSCTDADGNLTSCAAVGGTYAGGQVTFTPVAGANTIKLIATDACGKADTCQTVVNVSSNVAPDASCHGDTAMFVCSLAPITLSRYSCTDADGNLTSCAAVGGTYSGGQVTFTPVAGANTIKLIATDACGKADTCQTVVTVGLNQPPVVSCPGDTVVTFLCVPLQICRAGFSADDPEDNIVSKTVSFGTLSNGTVCFTPDTAGLYTIIYTATDQCGALDKCTTHVTVSYTNQPPVATCHGDTSMFVCSLAPITLGGYSCADVDGNLTSIVTVGGMYSAGQMTFTPVAGANTIKLIATDACGKADTCQTIVTVSVNNPPVCQIPGDQTYFVCGDTSFSFTIGATDPDGNLVGCTKVSGPGQLAGGIWTFTTTGPGVYTAAFRCSDQCQAICSDTVNITVNYNSAPAASCPGDRFHYLNELQEICQGDFACSDVDGNLADCEVTVNGVPDQMVGGQVCFMPQWGQNVIHLSAVDACGATGTCQTIITVAPPPLECPLVKIEKTHGTLQGHFEEVALTIENGPFEMGGFDFLIAYDASALTFNEAQPGELLDTCDWEYFTYRHGVSGNCGNACPSGLLRIIALAETNNGPNHPACYGPPDTEPHELAKMTFYVTNDRTYDCQYVPIYFFWMDCGDNALSSIDGENLFIDRAIYDFEGNVIWDEEDDVQFPEDTRIPFVGAPDGCLNPDPDKPSAVRCPEFVNGGIDIVCADSIDARGDINVNGVANEVADVVMLTNYFISGLSAFDTHKEASIAASDVNADGVSLSVADLVYLIRVISGDVAPYGRTASTGTVAISTNLAGGELTVSYDATTEVGAVFLIFEVDGIAGSPVLGSGASDMDVAYGQNGTELRVLIYDIGPGALASGIGEMVTIPVVGAIRLVEAEASDYYGNMMNVSTHLLPKEFSLGQNYPNPFNPTTTINLYLAEPSDWTVAIYNIAGQMIRMYSGSSDAGAVQVTWDGANSDGVKVTSGIYLYKATAGSFTATRKMVLMK